MNNAKLTYLYRDGANYKRWAEVVFSNEEHVPLHAATESLKSRLLPDGLFVAHQIRLPEVFLVDEYPINPDDHCFHEFDSLDTTDDAISDSYRRSLKEFLDEVVNESQHGWRAFDPRSAIRAKYSTDIWRDVVFW